MKKTFNNKKANNILIVTIFVLLLFLMCGCNKETEYVYTSGTTGRTPIESSSNSTATANQNTAAEMAMITVYTTETTELVLPNESEKVCGLASTPQQLLVFFMSNGNLSVAAYTPDGKYLAQQQLNDDKAAKMYAVTGILQENFAVRVRENDDENAKDKLIVYDTAFTQQSSCFLPDICRPLMGPVITADKNYIFWGIQSLHLVSANGEQISSVETSAVEIVSIVCAGEQCAAIAMSGNAIGICPIDWETCKLGEFVALGAAPACYSYFNGNEDTVLVNTNNILYRFDLNEQSYVNLIDWTSISTSGLNIRYLSELSSDQIAWSDGHIVVISTSEPHNIERKILTVASVGAQNARLESLVTNFNSSSKEYYAVVNYYDDPITLTTEIIAGSPPDVLEMTSVPIALTENNFENLLPYFDKDPEFAPEEFEESVLQAMLVNGKLLAMPSSFYLQTVVGRTRDVGAYHNWTIEDLYALLNEKGEGASAFPAWMTSKELMLWMANVSLGKFVDWSSLKCDFGDEFIALLNFCKEMPNEFDEEAYISDYAENILLTVQLFQNATWLEKLKRNYSGNEISYIGFPGNGTNNGSLFSSSDRDLLLAMPINATNKAAAWSLIRQILKKEWQETAPGLPIRKDVLQEQLGSLKDKQDALLTNADIEEFQSVIAETKLFIYNDNIINGIILEEAIPFFMGDRTATEVANLVDSRVSLYLAEKE